MIMPKASIHAFWVKLEGKMENEENEVRSDG